MTGAITFVCDVVFGGTRTVIVAVAMLLVYGWFWFAIGAIQRARSS